MFRQTPSSRIYLHVQLYFHQYLLFEVILANTTYSSTGSFLCYNAVRGRARLPRGMWFWDVLGVFLAEFVLTFVDFRYISLWRRRNPKLYNIRKETRKCKYLFCFQIFAAVSNFACCFFFRYLLPRVSCHGVVIHG